MFNVAILYLFA